MVGRLAGVTLEMLRLPALLTVLASGAALALSYELDLLSLGDEVAQSVGLSTRLARSALLTLAAVLCGAAVSFAGLVGFVGLLVPHAARFLVGTRHRDLLLASMLLGALLVTVCDLLGRVLFAPLSSRWASCCPCWAGPSSCGSCFAREGAAAVMELREVTAGYGGADVVKGISCAFSPGRSPCWRGPTAAASPHCSGLRPGCSL